MPFLTEDSAVGRSQLAEEGRQGRECGKESCFLGGEGYLGGCGRMFWTESAVELLGALSSNVVPSELMSFTSVRLPQVSLLVALTPPSSDQN